MMEEQVPGRKLIDALAGLHPEASKSNLKRWILHGKITLNGKVNMHPHHQVHEGDRIEYLKKVDTNRYQGNPPYRIHFEDPFLIIVDKPAGILTYGERGSGGTSLYKNLGEFLHTRTKKREELFVVHRLDREVSGIVLFAKSEKVQQLIKARWKEVTKKYMALVEGAVEKQQSTLKSFLKEGHDQKVFSVRNEEGARIAITHYRVVKEIPPYTLLEVILETGRKNQIRVHLSEMGNPVVGDYRYGAENKVRRRIRLHASYIEFRHPVTGKEMAITSELPRAFLKPSDTDEQYK